ncbi:MAG: cytochrome P450 [Gemmataceae bacterium]
MNDRYPPGPRDHFWGITFYGPMQADPLTFARRVAAEHGDFASMRCGWVRLYFVNRPSLIREILTTKVKVFKKMGRQMRALRKIEGNGLVVSDGAAWARHRPVVQGSFHARNMEYYARVFLEFARRRVSRWATGQALDMVEEMNELMMETIAKQVFDVDLAEDTARLREAVSVFRGIMQREITAPFVLPDWLPLPHKIRQRRAIRAVDDLIWRLIRERRESGVVKHDMLGQMFAAAAAQNVQPPITDAEIRDEAMTLFVAGHDTTSAALAWFWYLLSQHPEIERRAMAEVDALGNVDVTFEHLPRLKYVEMVVKESMRLYPATPFLYGRETTQDVELGGYTLPRGAWVLISPYIVQHDPRFHPEPETFDPERFSPQRIDDIPAYSYIPFGGGPRVCIGNAMATMEATLLAAIVLQRMRVKLDQAPPAYELEITLRPKGGLRMLPSAREKAAKLAG